MTAHFQSAAVIILGAGEPDFETPDHIKDAAIAAIRQGQAKYTALDGTSGLKQAIRRKFQRENGLDFSQARVSPAPAPSRSSITR